MHPSNISLIVVAGIAILFVLMWFRLVLAIGKHRAQRGMGRCWENDVELYRAIGVKPGDHSIFTITEEEHRKACDEYRRGLPLAREMHLED